MVPLINIARIFIPHKGLKTARWRRGFSLIEVAMAAILLTVALVPVLKNLTRAQQFDTEIERKTFSLMFAQGKLDEIKARSVYNFGSADSYKMSNVAMDNPLYLCNVTDVDAGTNLRTIIVSVGYDKDRSGILASDEIEVTLASYISQRWQ